MAKQIPYKVYLSEEEMPKTWYNIKAQMKTQHAPFINPATQQPCTKADLTPVDSAVDIDRLGEQHFTVAAHLLNKLFYAAFIVHDLFFVFPFVTGNDLYSPVQKGKLTQPCFDY